MILNINFAVVPQVSRSVHARFTVIAGLMPVIVSL